jgi:hypothetical protein
MDVTLSGMTTDSSLRHLEQSDPGNEISFGGKIKVINDKHPENVDPLKVVTRLSAGKIIDRKLVLTNAESPTPVKSPATKIFCSATVFPDAL